MGIVFSTVLIFYGIIFLIGRFTVDAVKQAPKRAISRRDADKIIEYAEDVFRKRELYNSLDPNPHNFNLKYDTNKEFNEQVTNRVCEILDSIEATYDNLPAREALRVWDTIPHRNYSNTHFTGSSKDLISAVWYLDQGIVAVGASSNGFGGWLNAPKFEAKCDTSKFYDWALKRLAEYGFHNAKLIGVLGSMDAKTIAETGDIPKTPFTSGMDTQSVLNAYVAIKNGDVKIY